MKKFLKIIFSIIFILAILGIIFYMIDTIRINNERDPIFVFSHKIIDGIDYSAKIDYGLGYKIIKFEFSGDKEVIRTGSFFIDESVPNVKIDSKISNYISGESGELIKITTFGENYKDKILIEGEENEVDTKLINSKLGYTGFDEFDFYVWNMTSSGEEKSTMTITNISSEDKYKEAIEKIQSDENYTEISGEQGEIAYYKVTTTNEINML